LPINQYNILAFSFLDEIVPPNSIGYMNICYGCKNGIMNAIFSSSFHDNMKFSIRTFATPTSISLPLRQLETINNM